MWSIIEAVGELSRVTYRKDGRVVTGPTYASVGPVVYNKSRTRLAYVGRIGRGTAREIVVDNRWFHRIDTDSTLAWEGDHLAVTAPLGIASTPMRITYRYTAAEIATWPQYKSPSNKARRRSKV